MASIVILLNKITKLEIEHDGLSPELVKVKNIKLGLRNQSGTGVVVGITSKGQVKGYERSKGGHSYPVPGKLYYCGYDIEEIVRSIEEDQRLVLRRQPICCLQESSRLLRT